MPIYEFWCRDCERAFEVVESIGDFDPKKVACPECGGKKVERRWSRVFAKTSKKS